MKSIRPLIIAAIAIVFVSIGLFFYAEHTNRIFGSKLPSALSQPDVADGDEKPMTEVASDMPKNRRHAIPTAENDIVDVPPSVRSPVERVDTATPPVPASEAEMSIEEIDVFFDMAFTFENINRDETFAAIEGMLRQLNGDDARIPEFMDLWEQAYTIMKYTDEYEARGSEDQALLSTILDMNPVTVLPAFLDLGIDLIHPSADEETRTREWIDGWVATAIEAEAALVAGSIANEAYQHGEITLIEAETFIEGVSGTDVELTPVEDSDQ